MTETVYADILFVTNAVITYLFLKLETVIFRMKASTLRMLAACALGGLFSFYILAPEQHFIVSSLIKLSFSAAIVFAAFKIRNVKRFLVLLLGFYAVSFTFAGIMIAVWIALRPKGMVINNSVVYFNVSVGTLLLTCALCYGVIILIQRVISKRVPQNSRCSVKIIIGEKSAAASAVIDTGNSLRDSFTGAPVIVARYESVEALIPPELRSFYLGKGELPYFIDPDFKTRMREIPYESIGGGGLLPAFKPDSIIIRRGKEKIRADKVIVAVTRGKLADNGCDVLLNAEMCGNIL